jgi:hypothetical protein
MSTPQQDRRRDLGGSEASDREESPRPLVECLAKEELESTDLVASVDRVHAIVTFDEYVRAERADGLDPRRPTEERQERKRSKAGNCREEERLTHDGCGARLPRMLLTREEMAYDFGGHKLDPVQDRSTIAWAVQQFLYGEMTGIQVGHWIYGAPDFDAARFLARQAVEEFQHVGNFLRILEILGEEPRPAHPAVRFLSTGAMPDSWPEHVALEMAIGEGLVLQAFYAMIDTIDHDEIVAILKRGVRQEERHVEFGEERTMMAIDGKPWLKRRLLGQIIVTLFAVRRLESYMKRTLPMDHAVMRQLPDFVRHSVAMSEKRVRAMGLSDEPIDSLPAPRKLALVAEAYGGKSIEGVIKRRVERALAPMRALGFFKKQRLTDTYLSDPAVKKRMIPPQTDADVGIPSTRPKRERVVN